MLSKVAILTFCIVAMLFLTGCGDSGSGAGGAFDLFGSPGGGNSPGGGLTLFEPSSGSSGTGGGSSGLNPHHSPEPYTVALIGGGLVAFALLRRRRRK